ncbi:hypothetical protein N7463_004590 [Penicillium fimorum]|uniref:Uncharacterized protein n=1 Tax=Penicillium fimorum TaxID=1882269 RepID=A0A9W9Y3F8_9EURO|nr:hypothetical protein N7463_004590 [Penicillium fimorum]
MSTVQICSYLQLKERNYSEYHNNELSDDAELNDGELNKDPEPHIRWLTLIFRDSGCQWWIKVIVIGTLT